MHEPGNLGSSGEQQEKAGYQRQITNEIMQSFFTTFTILATIMALPGLLAISPQADSLDSGRMIRLPRSAVDSMTSSNEASSLLQKRDFYGRGTYFEPGQGI